MSSDRVAYLHAIGTAVPGHDVHDLFLRWARTQVRPDHLRLFNRMADRSAIRRRWSVIPELADATPMDGAGFYAATGWPGTAARMRLYAETAPELALAAVGRLAAQVPVENVTHLVVASCTGFVAPGIDQIIARRLRLAPDVQRLLVGFMGCYAAVAALRSARQIALAEPGARVLVVCVELCTLHMQATDDIESLLAQLQFGDGAAAALVSAEPGGLVLERPFATTLPESDDLIRWTITDTGFVMHLSGAVPARIAQALADPATRDAVTGGAASEGVDVWAVHAGGRSILDAVQGAFALDSQALDHSRAVLADNGNMSSATLLFTLQRVLAGARVERGVALAFGPGLAAEGFGFRSAA